MASAMQNLRLPSQPLSATARWSAATYSAWWQRRKGVNNLPTVIPQPRADQESNPWPFDRKSDIQSVVPPCHPGQWVFARYIYFAHDTDAKYCDRLVCMSVCLSARISKKITWPNFTPNFLYILTVAIARSSLEDNSICYVLPVMRTTSYFHTMGHMARGVGIVIEDYMLQQVWS